MRKQTDCAISLGVNSVVRGVVFNLWTRLLELSGTAFTEEIRLAFRLQDRYGIPYQWGTEAGKKLTRVVSKTKGQRKSRDRINDTFLNLSTMSGIIAVACCKVHPILNLGRVHYWFSTDLIPYSKPFDHLPKGFDLYFHDFSFFVEKKRLPMREFKDRVLFVQKFLLNDKISISFDFELTKQKITYYIILLKLPREFFAIVNYFQRNINKNLLTLGEDCSALTLIIFSLFIIFNSDFKTSCYFKFIGDTVEEFINEGDELFDFEIWRLWLETSNSKNTGIAYDLSALADFKNERSLKKEYKNPLVIENRKYRKAVLRKLRHLSIKEKVQRRVKNNRVWPEFQDQTVAPFLQDELKSRETLSDDVTDSFDWKTASCFRLSITEKSSNIIKVINSVCKFTHNNHLSKSILTNLCDICAKYSTKKFKHAVKRGRPTQFK